MWIILPMETTLVRPPLRASSNPDLDYLLAEVAVAVQLSATQYEKASGHYLAVADWLGATGSPLAGLGLTVYPQGSMALETTVKPRGDVEHDLDLVCQVMASRGGAMDLYNTVHDRLYANETYRPMLTRKNRCLRLRYQGDFHLDLIPAIPDRKRGGTSVLVPDRELQGWTESNPKGYVEWFKSKSVALFLEQLRMAKADAEPLPAQRPSDEKPPLAIAVQLMKRARDVEFDGADVAPRSIIITTLAALHYGGSICVTTTMLDVLRKVQQQIGAASPRIIEIVNPTNDGEKFSDALTPERYEALIDYVATLEARISALPQIHGVERLQVALERLFGEKPVTTALERYAERQKALRDGGRLTYSRAGLGIVAPVSAARAPKHTYFGD
jgi:Second Messenger Oligonucleotide or Dinucleotide Synthetase domain